MNHCVPEFEMEDDYSTPAPSRFSRPKKSAAGEEDIMELLWQNGQVVVQSQNQRPPKKSAVGGGGGEVAIQVEREIRSSGEEQQHLFMQEDEMASWLQYPLDDSSFDRDLYVDLLYSAPPPPNPVSTITQPRTVAEIRPPPAPPRPPIPPAVTKPDNSPRLQNFVHFSRLPSKPRSEPISKPSVTIARESTVVESNETPAVGQRSRISHSAADSRPLVNVESGTATACGTSAATGELAAGTRDITETSSPGGSGASFSASGETRKPQKRPQPAAADRKRKGREADDNECQSEDIEFEAAEAKKQARPSAKRSRAAEVHNLSERRRRDRINEKMRALQELIPRCNKSDKASMLDEAIEYLKSLQLQVQMMSMGCSMIPMMYPGMQQYMPAMGLGMGMGMDLGMTRPMVPYPAMLPGSAVPNSGVAAHMGPRFPMPAFHMPPVPGPEPSRVQGSNQTDPVLNPAASHNPNQPRIPNFVDPYQSFLGLHQAQVPIPQNQAVVQPGANKPSTSKDIVNPDNQQAG